MDRRVVVSERSYPNLAVVTHVLNDGKCCPLIRPFTQAHSLCCLQSSRDVCVRVYLAVCRI